MEKSAPLSTMEQQSVDVPSSEVSKIEPLQSNEMEKPFNLWSTLGVQYSITATPLAIGTYLSFVIGVGGSPVFVYGFILSTVMNLLICLSLAEIAAVLPNSSGQIYWTAVLSPKKSARGLSYVCGWLTCGGWFFWTAGAFLIASQLIWALVQACNSVFVALPWHYYILYIGLLIVALILNIPLFKVFPHITRGLMVFINVGTIFILVTLLARVHPKQSASYVFADIVNYTGWKSNGVVFFLGLLPGLTGVNGFDGAAHLAEELPNPGRHIPQVMFGSAVLSAISGFVMILIYMFCIANPDNLSAPVGGQPVVQLMLDSFNSLPLTIIGTLVFIITFIGGSSCTFITFTRVWWSFSRSGGVPFSPFFSRLNSRYLLPVNSIIFCFILTVAVGAIELGSATALNAILGGGIICILASYALPIAALLVNKRAAFPITRYFNLGKFGPALNVISIVWIAFIFVWLCFPLYLPVTPLQ